jgi:signal transduction histidine kinase
MLEHSRATSGEWQPTNINVLASEFLDLSYHGMEAKDPLFKAGLVTNFAKDLPKIRLAQQDIGRVLVNLFNNAFYAVNQKQKAEGAGYIPVVTITTALVPAKGDAAAAIIISVTDNGHGIPGHIRDKIMQPFFSTKPSGEGTGLGLSLSYDIVVKGHGGAIHVDSIEGEFATFTVQLPYA